MTPADQEPHEHEFTRTRFDLDPHYAWLQANDPVARIRLPDGAEAWLVTRWQDARQVLADPVFSRAAAVGRSPSALRRETFITDMAPPQHTRVRRHALTAFTHQRVQALRPRAHRRDEYENRQLAA